MAINRFGMRVLAVLLCLSLVVYISVGKVHADGGVVSIPFAVVLCTLALGAGIVFATSADAQEFAVKAWNEIQSGSANWEAVKLQLYAAQLAFVNDGIQGLRDTITMDTLNEFMIALANMGMSDESLPLSSSNNSILISRLVSEGTTINPYALFGNHFVVINPNGVRYVVGSPYVVGNYKQVNYQYLSSWNGQPLTGSNGTVLFQYNMTSDYWTDPRWQILDSTMGVSWITGYYGSGFGIRVLDTQTGNISWLNSSAYGGSPPEGGGGSRLMSIIAALGGTAALINYVWEKDIVENHLKDKEPSSPVYFTQVVTPETAPGKRTGDVIRWSDGPSGGESSEPSESSTPVDVGSPVSIGGLLTLFIPKETFLSEQFDKMMLKFPELGNLDELRGLAELGERKPNMRVVLNGYFGITTNQTGIDIDVWDDKRELFKSWIRAALIIFNIIFGFNQCYKLVKNGSFTDTGTGSNNNQIEGQQRWFS